MQPFNFTILEWNIKWNIWFLSNFVKNCWQWSFRVVIGLISSSAIVSSPAPVVPPELFLVVLWWVPWAVEHGASMSKRCASLLILLLYMLELFMSFSWSMSWSGLRRNGICCRRTESGDWGGYRCGVLAVKPRKRLSSKPASLAEKPATQTTSQTSNVAWHHHWKEGNCETSAAEYKVLKLLMQCHVTEAHGGSFTNITNITITVSYTHLTLPTKRIV